MSRDSNGTYTLPSGNPVVTGTTITSAWSNGTFNDVGAALTDSLSRSGLGSMTAGLKLFSGTNNLPGLSWSAETTSGWYRAGLGDFRYAVSTVDIFTLTAAVSTFINPLAMANVSASGILPSAELASTLPRLNFRETDAAANNRIWSQYASGESLFFAVSTDTGTLSAWLTVDRTAGTVDTVNFTNGVLQYAGGEVGYRDLNNVNQAGNYTLLTTDRGGAVQYTGAGGHTFTLPAGLPLFSLVTIINTGTGNLTLTAATTLNWMGGAGSIPTGNRTLAVGGMCNVWCISSGPGTWRVWGVGLS